MRFPTLATKKRRSKAVPTRRAGDSPPVFPSTEKTMPRIEFTNQLARHVECPTEIVEADSVREALEVVFTRHPALRGYVMDDQGSVRKHVAVFVDNKMLQDLGSLDIPLTSNSEVFVMQALSGG